jgi:2-keto-4-pentenoate hydratase/2-oxohepta-3-ene-1,7-dioic acid hydratase in catechol pathway
MKIICIGHNYKNHIKELNLEFPDEPVFFLKPESAVLRNHVFFLPDFSDNVQHEIEIVIRITRLGRRIQAKFAHRYFEEIGIGLDLTARDIQVICKEKGLPWEISKAFDGSAVISDFIPISEFKDINKLQFHLTKNDEIVQAGSADDMIFNYDQIIEHVSKYMTLKMGDLIFTGTPAGVSKMKNGDEYVAYLEGKEMLRITVK